MTNIRTADFQDREAPPGFRSRRARIGYELGTEAIGASIWEIPPGEAAYPYHFRGGLSTFFRRGDAVDYWDGEVDS